MEMARFAEPELDVFAFEDWRGAEVYKGESYIEMPNGDRVLDEVDLKLEWMEENGTKKIAGEEI